MTFRSLKRCSERKGVSMFVPNSENIIVDRMKRSKYLAIADEVKKKIRPHFVVLMYLLKFYKTVCSMTKTIFKSSAFFQRQLFQRRRRHLLFEETFIFSCTSVFRYFWSNNTLKTWKLEKTKSTVMIKYKRHKMSIWTSFFKIWTVCSSEFNANYLTVWGLLELAKLWSDK